MVGGSAFVALRQGAQTQQTTGWITDVEGLKVGHFTETRRPTGCTVILCEAGAVASVDVRGAAPGTRETDLLDPVNTVEKVHAVVLSGGSAFGLETAGGVMRYLEERNIGFRLGRVTVPIVPAAILFDLGVGDPGIRPNAENGYKACEAARTGKVEEGNAGAGTGATVGKIGGGSPMKGGIGTSSIRLPNGIVVGAIVAVNCVGDVIDRQTGKPMAGARTADGKEFLNIVERMRQGHSTTPGRIGENSSIGVVATNAALTKTQAAKVAQMAQDGLARAINPVHTLLDGDTLFALATGASSSSFDLNAVGTLAAEAVSDAVVRAVRAATSIPGFPAMRDIPL